MSDYSPSRVAVARNGEGSTSATAAAVVEAEAADDALEDDPVTTIGEAPNGQAGQREKEALAQGLFHLFKPAVDNIDGRVKAVRQSQVELRAHIDNLAEDLRRISDCRVVPIDLEPYVKKLLNTRRRILALANLLQTVQDRVNKVNYYVTRDKNKKNQMIKPSTTKMLDDAAKTASTAASTATTASAATDQSAEEIIIAAQCVDPVAETDDVAKEGTAEVEEEKDITTAESVSTSASQT